MNTSLTFKLAIFNHCSSYLIIGILWILISFAASLGRIFVLKLDLRNTYIGWFVEGEASCDIQVETKLIKLVHKSPTRLKTTTSSFSFLFPFSLPLVLLDMMVSIILS